MKFKTLIIPIILIFVVIGFLARKLYKDSRLEQPIENSTIEDTPKPKKNLDTLPIKTTSKTPEVNDDTNFVNDSLYRWNRKKLDWSPIGIDTIIRTKLDLTHKKTSGSSKPIRLKWKTLEAINYRLEHIFYLDSDVFKPIFDDTQLQLHGKDVIIKGYVVPFDKDNQILALSANTYKSCFFCGKASPASVISLYLKKKGKRYKLDDFKTFKGTLYLNQDDPDQYYYILKNAVEL